MTLDFSTTLNFVCFVLTIVAFIFGAIKLFNRNVPIYFRICVCAVGCYALGGLSECVYAICTGEFTADVSISMLGLFGCLFFMISANLEGDKIDKREELKIHYKKHDLFAYIAPAILGVALIYMIYVAKDQVTLSKIIFLTIVYIPILPASFLSLLYLVRPSDAVKIYKYTKLSNLFILLFCILSVADLYLLINQMWDASSICSLVCVLALCALMYSCCRGAKGWKSISREDLAVPADTDDGAKEESAANCQAGPAVAKPNTKSNIEESA
ncbi:MAG: hypothetical protein MJ189_02785 [Coriobacteriales bacterium]|nr:hypothetical protein [Coriobacteriales bacterium]